MKIRELLNERISTETLLKDGKLKKIEFYVSTGDNFPERVAQFLQDLSNFTSAGASRTVGIVDDNDAKAIQLFIDGDGADRIRDIKIV